MSAGNAASPVTVRDVFHRHHLRGPAIIDTLADLGVDPDMPVETLRQALANLPSVPSCQTCGDNETVRCDDPDCDPDDGDRHEHWIACPDCCGGTGEETP